MENKLEWGCKCICFKVLHAVSVSILPDCLEQHAMSNCVLLVIPGPRASQIKGWWCTHHHISRCPVDQQQNGRGRWGRSPHMIPAVHSHTDGSHREEPLEGRFSNVSWHLSGHSRNTLSGALLYCTCCTHTVLYCPQRGMPVRVWWELKAWRSHGLCLSKKDVLRIF